MELSEALAISFINAAIISILLLILYTINIKKRKIEVFGPYLFKLEESGELKEVTEPIPPEISEALREAQKKLIQDARKRFEERFKPIDKWYNIAIITIIIFIVTFIVQLIIFLHI